MDHAYATFPTPLGEATAVLSPRGLTLLRFRADARSDAAPPAVREFAQLGGVPARHDPALLLPWRTELEEYFAGTRRVFTPPLDLGRVRGFARRALERVCEVPYGETAGYGEIAVSAGSPGAARAVGSACARTPISVAIPVHRVVRADGTPGSYGSSPDARLILLDIERRSLSQGSRR